MLDDADFARLVGKLDSGEGIEPPKFPPGWRPAGRHSGSGSDCTALSKAGLTQTVAFIGVSEARSEGEFCPCGALRHVINDTPERDWNFINRCFDDRAWAASTTETTEPSADPVWS
jgi:hypothetical protein